MRARRGKLFRFGPHVKKEKNLRPVQTSSRSWQTRLEKLQKLKLAKPCFSHYKPQLDKLKVISV